MVLGHSYCLRTGPRGLVSEYSTVLTIGSSQRRCGALSAMDPFPRLLSMRHLSLLLKEGGARNASKRRVSRKNPSSVRRTSRWVYCWLSNPSSNLFRHSGSSSTPSYLSSSLSSRCSTWPFTAYCELRSWQSLTAAPSSPPRWRKPTT